MLWAQNPSFQEGMPAANPMPAGTVRSNVGFGRGDLLYGVDPDCKSGKKV
jgi:hypothetical protein